MQLLETWNERCEGLQMKKIQGDCNSRKRVRHVACMQLGCAADALTALVTWRNIEHLKRVAFREQFVAAMASHFAAQ